MTATPGPRRGTRRPGAGRKPTPTALHRKSRTITLSPAAWDLVTDYRRHHPAIRSDSAAIEALIRSALVPF